MSEPLADRRTVDRGAGKRMGPRSVLEPLFRLALWLGIPRLLRGLGFGPLVGWVNARRLAHARGRIAARHLSGRGLEIGALHLPLPLPREARVFYLDLRSRTDNLRLHPEFSASSIVATNIVGDGARLACIAPRSLDFLVANHMLEHVSDALGALELWAASLRPGGHLFVTVPIGGMCFDRGRPITSLTHIIEDHRLLLAGNLQEFRTRNREHYREFVTISETNLGSSVASAEDVAARVDSLAAGDAEIHFHTFSAESFEDLLRYFCQERRHAVQIVDYCPQREELIAVLRHSRAT